jgi:hypothetical protein
MMFIDVSKRQQSAHPTSTHWSTRSRVSSSWSTQESSALHRLIIGSLDTVNIHNRLHGYTLSWTNIHQLV